MYTYGSETKSADLQVNQSRNNSRPTREPRIFRLFSIEVRYTSIIITLLGLLSFLIPWNHGDAHEIRVAIATAVLTIGVIGLINDAYLRRSFTEEALGHAAIYLREHFAQELFTSLGLARDFLETGVQRVDVGTQPDWATLFENASKIQCLLIEPAAWMAGQWPAVVAAARESGVEVSIYAPDPKHTELDEISSRYDLGLVALRENVRELRRRVEQEWDAAKDAPAPNQRLHADAQVRVKFYRGVPSFSATLADHRGALVFSQAFGAQQGDQPLVINLDAETDTTPISWLRDQLDKLEQLTDDFYGSGSTARR